MATGPKLTNSEKDFQTLGFPIFGLAGFKDKLIVSGGVGAKNVGFQDQIIVFEQGLPLNKKIHQEELEYNLQFLNPLPCLFIIYNIFCHFLRKKWRHR